MTLDLPATMRASIAAGGEADALWHSGRWRSWRWVERSARRIAAASGDARRIGLVARNRPHHLAAFAGAVVGRRTTAMLYAAQGPVALAADIERLGAAAIVADREDWSADALAAARAAGCAAVAIGDGEHEAEVVRLADATAIAPAAGATADAVELLSSGTTGRPKRVPLSWSTVARAVESAAGAYTGSGDTGAPQVMAHPLGNVAGLGYALPPLAFGQRLVLLDRFEPRAWAEAVRDHRPVRGTVPPAGIRMLLDADIPPAWLSSLSLVAVGGGALSSDLQDAFEARFGVPLLRAFGATEFGGVVANWTLDLSHRWAAEKRGSAGRASAGVTLRAVDRETGAPLPSGVVGLLEARVDRIGPDWIRTTDLASLDADGFLFLHGRADGAINRGGFKIVPEVVADALRACPAVADAAVVGRADARLGEVPVAAVELRAGHRATAEMLDAFLRDRLPAYQLPAELRIVPALPRNGSLKVSLAEVKALFG